MKTKIGMAVVLGVTIASVASADMRLNFSAVRAPMAIPQAVMSRGGLVGNGGGTVVCRDNRGKIKSIELLDFYEARTLRNVNVDIKTIPGDWKAKAQGVINRIEAKSEMRFQLYSQFLARFELEDKLLANVEFSTVPDSGYIGVPRGCQFEQAAIQRKPDFSGDARYWINQELWTAMDDSQKAGLVLHEIIYREAIGYGHTDSIRTRFLTAAYSSSDFAAQTVNTYWKTLGQAHFETTDVKFAGSQNGEVISWFDPTRIWQAGPDEQSIPQNIKLFDAFLVKVGDCSGDGCETFDSNGLDLITPADPGWMQLSKDINSIRIGQTNFAMSQGMVHVGVNGVATPSGGKLENITFFSRFDSVNGGQIDFHTIKSETFCLYERSKLNSADAASDFVMEKKQGSVWSWKFVTARSVSRGVISSGQNPSDESDIPIIGVVVPASTSSDATATVSYVDGVPSEAKINISVLPNPANIGSGLIVNNNGMVWNHYANGSGIVGMNSLSSPVKFDPVFPDQILDPASPDLMWWYGPMTSLYCASSIADGSNCLHPTVSADRKVSNVTVINSNVSVSFSCKVVGPNEQIPVGAIVSFPSVGTTIACKTSVVAKRGTDIPIDANGVPRSLVVAEATQIQINGQTAPVAAGQTIDFDTAGNPILIH